jgi:carbon-monoxide dehydrogenase iron sulfur subunit
LKVVKLDPERCETCHTCEIACVLNHSDVKDIDEAMKKRPEMHQRILIIEKKGKPHALICVNCKKPKCVDACEYDAITKL